MGQLTRKEAREAAFLIIFEYDFRLESWRDIIEHRLSQEGFAEFAGDIAAFRAIAAGKNLEYCRRLTTGVAEHLPELDSYSEKLSVGWSFARLSRVCKTVLRLCMYELLYMPDIPPRASINEAVEIVKKYDSDEAGGFINGILASYLKTELKEMVSLESRDKPGEAAEPEPQSGEGGTEN